MLDTDDAAQGPHADARDDSWHAGVHFQAIAEDGAVALTVPTLSALQSFHSASPSPVSVTASHEVPALRHAQLRDGDGAATDSASSLDSVTVAFGPLPPTSPSFTTAQLTKFEGGINSALGQMQSLLDTEAYAEKLPFVGGQLKKAYDAGQSALATINTFKTTLFNALNSLNSASDKSIDNVQQIIQNALASAGITGTVTAGADASGATLSLTLDKAQSWTQSLDAALGLPGLGLTTAGSATAAADFHFTFDVGVDSTGFYVDTADNPDLTIDLGVKAASFSTDTDLGFLRFNAAYAGTGNADGNFLDGHFNVGLSDTDGTVDGKLRSFSGSFINGDFSGSADINLNLHGDMSSAALPSINAGLSITSSFSGTLGGTVGGAAPTVTWHDVTYDFGSFVQTFIKPVLQQLNPILQPIHDALAIFDTDITPLDQFKSFLDQTGDGKVTLLDFLKIAEPSLDVSGFQNFADLVAKLIDWAGYIENHDFGADSYDLGSFTLPGGVDVRDVATILANVAPAITQGADDLQAFLSAGLTGSGWTGSDTPTGGEQAQTGSQIIQEILQDFQFPVLTDPTQAFKMLLGGNATLFQAELPTFNLGLGTIDANGNPTHTVDILGFSPFPGINIDLSGAFDISADVGFGYDTRGLAQFAASHFTNFADVLDGFYMSDNQVNGVDHPEVTLSAALQLSVDASIWLATIGGGGNISGQIMLDLNDTVNGTPADGRVYLDEMGTALATDPLSLFNISGRITAGFDAFVDVAGHDLWRYDSPRFTLADFSFDPKQSGDQQTPPGLGTLNGSTLQLNIGDHAANRTIPDKTDGDESFAMVSGHGVTVSAFDHAQSFSGVTAIVGNGGAGDDEIMLDKTLNVAATLNGGTGTDFLYGGAAGDVLSGDDGRDYLYGYAGKDALHGGTGDDVLNGGSGADTLDGGDGYDIASYADSTTGVSINLATGIAHGGDAEGDTFVSIEEIEGSQGADSLTGGSANDVFFGKEGNDMLSGGDGDDYLVGGAGADHLDGGNGIDTASYISATSAVVASLATGTGTVGDAQGDTYVNIEILEGSGYDDQLTGGPGADVLNGGLGNDTLTGGAGNDILVGGAGADSLDGGDGSDLASYYNSGTGVTLSLANGTGTGGDAAGDVFVSIERVEGSNAFDPAHGISGDDAITGDAGANTLLGWAGNDVLDGGAGTDLIQGGDGNDTLLGGDDNDTLTGGAGADHLDGGNGIDLASYAGSAQSVNVNLGTGVGSGGDAQGDVLVNIESVEGSNVAGKGDTLTGGANDDNLYGLAGDDSLSGGGGNDVLVGGTGNDHMVGGGGQDTADYSASVGGVAVNLSNVSQLAGGTTLAAGTALDGLGGTDTLSQIEIVIGTQFADTMFATANGSNLQGMAGDDALTGGNGQDKLDGGDGNDTLAGGAGVNTLVGGAGDDVLVTTQSPDSVDGGAGVDLWQADLSHATKAIAIDLTSAMPQTFLNSGTLQNVERLALSTGSGNDTIVTGSGFYADTVSTGGGTDTVTVLAGRDTIDLGTQAKGAADTLIVNWAGITDAIATMGLTADPHGSLSGSLADAAAPSDPSHNRVDFAGVERFQITSGSGDDAITTGGGNDSITGGSGNDHLSGGAGDDLLEGNTGNDVLDGGTGIDIATYANAHAAAIINLSAAAITVGSTTVASNQASDGDGGTDTLIGIEGAIGSNFNDTMVGSASADSLTGGNGDDNLDGGAGNDTMTGGAGNDTYHVDSLGDKVIDGGGGTDLVIASIDYSIAGLVDIENLTLVGTARNGTGNALANVITGTSGDDRLDGGAGADLLIGGTGNDTYVLDDPNDRVTELQNAGTDTLLVQTANFTDGFTFDMTQIWTKNVENLSLVDSFHTLNVTGNNLNNAISDNLGNNTISGGAGNDVVTVTGGGDNVSLGTGTDTMVINYGSDTYAIGGSAGPGASGVDGNFSDGVINSVAFTSAEMLSITTGSGADNITTGDEVDQITTGNGDDIVVSGKGNDIIALGSGNDGWGADKSDATTNITLDLVNHVYSGPGSATGMDYIYGTFSTGSGNDTIVTTSAAVSETINTNAGNDSVTVAGGGDTVAMGTGTDTLIVNYGSDTYAVGGAATAGAGGLSGSFSDGVINSVSFTGVELLNITTGSGADNIVTGDEVDQITTNAGDDIVVSGKGNDVLSLGSGNDGWGADKSDATTNITLDLVNHVYSGPGSATGVDYIYGTFSTGSGNDTIVTTSAAVAEVIDTNGGDDTVTVAGGSDTVALGSGTDTLIMNYGSDTYAIGGSATAGADGLSGSFSDGVINSVSFTGVELLNITTGSGADNIVTGDEVDSINTGAGDDVIVSGKGADTIVAGTGNDGWGADKSDATTNITLDLVNHVYSGPGSATGIDYIYGTFSTGSGNDTIVTTSATVAEVIDTNAGDDTVTVAGGSDTVALGSGTDTLIMNYGSDTFAIGGSATAGADGLSGSFSDGVINSVSFSGADLLNLTTGSGADNIVTGDEVDTINTGAGDDIIVSGKGADTIIAGNGNDGWGADKSDATTDITLDLVNHVYSGPGSETGVEYIYGTFSTGSGNDTIVTTSAAANEVIDTNAGDDTVTVAGGSDTVSLGAGSDTLIVNYAADSNGVGGSVSQGADGFDGSFSDGVINSVSVTGADVISITTGSGADTITTGGGADTLVSGAGNDMLNGGAGNDTLTGGLGADTLTGGDGSDTFYYTSVADSAPTASDLITDLDNSDVIDLSHTGVHFRLVSAFDHQAGELVVSYNGTVTTVTGYVGADNKADFLITISGDHHDFTNFLL